MALVKRGKTWHTHIFVNGVRYRQSLGTRDWREAQAREKDLVSNIMSGRALGSHREFAKWPFDKAVEHYLNSRRLHLAERSLAKERELLNHPKRYFGSCRLVRLTPEMMREYLAKRRADGLSNTTINMEAGALRRLFKMAKRWHVFSDDIKRLPEQSHVGRALTGEELDGLLMLAESRSEWAALRLAIVLAVNTTMRSAELKNLRWRDIDLLSCTIIVRRSKTEAGQRVIPMNEDARAANLSLRKGAQALAADAPEDFLFPACESGSMDPHKPQKSWRTAWRSLTRSIQCHACSCWQNSGAVCRYKACRADISGIESPTAGLRFHDLRHTAIYDSCGEQRERADGDGNCRPRVAEDA